MKPIAIAMSFLVVILSLSACGRTKAKSLSVSAATISQLPSGQTYEIDLTKRGTVYAFSDKDTDFSRVTIRTDAGVRTFADLLKASNTSLDRGLIIGTLNDMRDYVPTSGGTTTNYDCGVICKCDGGQDCINMIVDGKCTNEIWCSSASSSCFCVAKP